MDYSRVTYRSKYIDRPFKGLLYGPRSDNNYSGLQFRVQGHLMDPSRVTFSSKLY